MKSDDFSIMRIRKVALLGFVILLSVLIFTIYFIIGDEDKAVNEQQMDFTQVEVETKVFTYDISGYCHNPEYPDLGPSEQSVVVDWERLTGDRIYKQIQLDVYWGYEDDHFGSRSPKDTGDIISVYEFINNITTGEEAYNGGVTGFEGGAYGDWHIYLKNISDGIHLEPIYHMDLSIENCGEYPKYGGPGLITEPDLGNSWNATLTLTYKAYIKDHLIRN